jgi:hypothetical protein
MSSLKQKMIERYPVANVNISYLNGGVFAKSVVLTILYLVLSQQNVQQYILRLLKTDRHLIYQAVSGILFLIASYFIMKN